ncbi:elongation factor Ts [Thiohalorhabdus denitrificans]|uniref:Elongation factor Ts n=1 Tax=Thiohalorhabdus denitrificans TaxID=381306 RepID=A0A0P9CXW0_9GAMM|nr:translation elongation factor Ts [Thiohalorhabdus denitrificans]KPV41721.1 elongation factor Ts [Thiohalorhabdus denitrificans]SCY54404.1 elongation factor Ts [Thiohalorhabdus denitrificans]
MSISAQDVKTLRERTGAGMMECKKCLEEAGGDMDKAMEVLKQKGLAQAEKKAGRTAAEGVVTSYIHGNGKIGVLVEVNCETDFVGKNEDFQNFARDIAMHVAASNPEYVRREDIPEERVQEEKDLIKSQSEETVAGKPEHVVDQILEGKLNKNLSAITLLDQPFVKDPDKTVGEYTKEVVAKLGENIRVRRFVRYEVGEGIEVEQKDFAEEVKEQLGE